MGAIIHVAYSIEYSEWNLFYLYFDRNVTDFFHIGLIDIL